ncbi:TonB-dependent receptor [Pseudomonas lalucatii]|nr:TonB-dependent receptor [Pseudomonas lalucatii]
MKLSPLTLAMTLAPGLALAAEPTEPYQAQPLVVTRGTPLQQPAPASVAVVTRRQIEASAASSLVEVLRTQAGLQIRDTLGDGNRVALSLRGFGENAANNTLVLVDGRRLNNPSQQAADLNSVPLANIERIEIIRGAGTVLYGDQAVGGVVNIITRTPLQDEAYVETSRGSHDLEAYRGHAFRQLGGGFRSTPTARRGMPTATATTTTPVTATPSPDCATTMRVAGCWPNTRPSMTNCACPAH